MNIIKIIDDKKRFLDLLLLADEQESMIDRYLERGDLFALYDGDLKSIAVVTDEGNGTFELKNLATCRQYQGQGYGKKLVEYLCQQYAPKGNFFIVGTGDSPLTIPFYQHCGFSISHRVKNYFTDYYDHPIFEDGIQLVDMVYLKRDLKSLRGEVDPSELK